MKELHTLSGEHHEIGDEGGWWWRRPKIPLYGAPNGLQIWPPDEEQDAAATPYREMRWNFLSGFFLRETEYMELELRLVEQQGAHGCGPPGLDSFASIFYIFQKLSPWIFRSFRELLFSAQK